MFLAVLVYDDPLEELLLFTISTPYSAVISCLTNVPKVSLFQRAFSARLQLFINTRVNTARG